jgi:kynurenine 3-monooxygenase
MSRQIAIVGAGLVGCALAHMLARRGHEIVMYEKRQAADAPDSQERRSTHLVVSARGWKALGDIGVADQVRDMSLPLAGRCIHLPGQAPHFQPYGADGQTIFAIQRSALNRLLRELCADNPRIDMRFAHRCIDAQASQGRLTVLNSKTGRVTESEVDILFAADGAFSGVRGALMKREAMEISQRSEHYGYKEFTLSGGQALSLRADTMHAWPRGDASLFAFPNADGSFTGTLIAPFNGHKGFSSLDDARSITALFDTLFPDVSPDAFIHELLDNPASSLFTFRCRPWVFAGRAALIGDAAHAMVPFLGQGMNAGFEDCSALMDLLDKHHEDFARALPEFESSRRDNCEAVTDMSLQAFEELSQSIGNPEFLFRRSLQQRIQTLFPQRYAAPYDLIAFTHTPYAEVKARIDELERLTDAILDAASPALLMDEDASDRYIHMVIDRQKEFSHAA